MTRLRHSEPGRPSMAEVLGAFLWIGLMSFGGGRAAYFQDALVLRRRWIEQDEFLEAVAIAQVLPGPTVGNLAGYLGYRLHGWPGAIGALACVTIPGGVLILALAALYFGGMPATIAVPIGRGVSAASAGIAVAAVIRLRGGARRLTDYAVAGVTFALFGPLHWPVHWVLAVCLPLGFLLAWRARA